MSSVLAVGCADAVSLEEPEQGGELDQIDQEVTDPLQRVYNVVEAALPAGNYDGVAGDECVLLLNPEHRLRKIILVQAAGAGGACSISAYGAGAAMSFTWGDTTVYQGAAGITALRAALSDGNGAVHRLTGSTSSEASAFAALQSFLTLPFAQQSAGLVSFTAKRVHSLYDFEGQEEVYAEAAYQAVRVTGPCENPGSPRLESRTFAGFVYGYTASNSGSCHSGWFSKLHIYNRNWQRVGTQEYSE